MLDEYLIFGRTLFFYFIWTVRQTTGIWKNGCIRCNLVDRYQSFGGTCSLYCSSLGKYKYCGEFLASTQLQILHYQPQSLSFPSPSNCRKLISKNRGNNPSETSVPIHRSTKYHGLESSAMFGRTLPPSQTCTV